MAAVLPANRSRSSKHSHGLFWKELMESRVLIWWALGFTIVFFFGDVACSAISNGGLGTVTTPGRVQSYIIDAPDDLMLLAWALIVALNGSGLVSPELGSKTLLFLSSLPLSRNRIWWNKVFSSLFVTIIGLIISIVVYFGLVLWCSYIGVMTPIHYRFAELTNVPSHALIPEFRSELKSLEIELPIFSPYLLPVFALGSLITVLVDRTITAFLLTVIVSVFGASLLAELAEMLTTQHEYLIALPAALLTLLLLYLSNQVFVGGETLLTRKRYSIIFWILLRDVGIVVVALIAAYYILIF